VRPERRSPFFRAWSSTDGSATTRLRCDSTTGRYQRAGTVGRSPRSVRLASMNARRSAGSICQRPPTRTAARRFCLMSRRTNAGHTCKWRATSSTSSQCGGVAKCAAVARGFSMRRFWFVQSPVQLSRRPDSNGRNGGQRGPCRAASQPPVSRANAGQGGFRIMAIISRRRTAVVNTQVFAEFKRSTFQNTTRRNANKIAILAP
jgi:hypothetical protein